MLRAAHDALHGQPPAHRVCQRVTNFVKVEEYPEYKHARSINSRCDAFKAWSGPLFKAIEQQVYDVQTPVRFIKHIPVSERAAAINSLPSGRIYSTDFTSYEKHFTKEIMEAIEFPMYQYMLPFLSKLEQSRLYGTLAGMNHINSRAGLRCHVKARRMSGEMCTSLGNGFANLILASYIAKLKKGVIHGFVEGDDGLFSTNFEITARDYAKLGFEIKILTHEKVACASFCGLIFSEAFEIIRNPVDFMAKFGWSSSGLLGGLKLRWGLLRAKALSAVYETPQCPIVGAVARYALSVSRHVRPHFVYDGYHKHEEVPRDESNLPAFNPHPSTRALFADMFGISIESQLIIEEQALRGDFSRLTQMLRTHPHQIHYCTRYLTS